KYVNVMLMQILLNSFHSGSAPPLCPSESRSTDPDPYAGQPGLCRGFLFQCLSMFQQRPARFPSDAARIRYVCGLLRGRALQWAEAKFSNSDLDSTDFETFLTDFKLVFGHPHYQPWEYWWVRRTSQPKAID
uniref:DUF4939 domain-containing protein n=1 Tax=Periophthalmus magnuspinnatus TaxID=409849 RepID=A0A3B3ZY85_9GOBI